MFTGSSAPLFILIFSSILAWASFFSIIFFTSPQSAGILGVVVLYAGATIGLASFSLILWQIIKLSRYTGSPEGRKKKN